MAGSRALPAGFTPTALEDTITFMQQINAAIASGTGAQPGDPTATAGPAAIDGSASTFMRSDAAPAVQVATTGRPGLVQPDGSTITIDGDVISAVGGGGGSTNWKYKNADYTAVAGDMILADTSGATFTITLPASPADGDTITIWDFNGTFGTNPISLSAAVINNGNGYTNNVTGSSPGHYTDGFQGDYLQIVWSSDVDGGVWWAQSFMFAGQLVGWVTQSESPGGGLNSRGVLIATGDGAGNIDAVINIGGGALCLVPPDGGSSGGNARGLGAVDLQTSISKGSPTTVASGQFAYCEGNGNTASGIASHAEGSGTIAIGFLSHAEGTQTTAQGTASHAEGSETHASGVLSHAEGQSTTANGTGAHAEGYTTIAYGSYSHAEGENTTANGSVSHAQGCNTEADGFASQASGQDSWDRGIYAAKAHSSGQFSARGDQQVLEVGLKGQTTDATPLVLTADGGSASAANQLALVDNETCFVDVFLFGKVAGATDCIAVQRQCLIQRGAGAATTTMASVTVVGGTNGNPNVITSYASAGAIAGSWDSSLSADTANGALSVTVIGASSTTINWTAEVRSRELVS
jgi:hypothetical protein